jgi:hypothetical protein
MFGSARSRGTSQEGVRKWRVAGLYARAIARPAAIFNGFGSNGLAHDPEKWTPVSRLREALATELRLA